MLTVTKLRKLITGKGKTTKVRIKIGHSYYQLSEISTEKQCKSDDEPSLILHVEGTEIRPDEVERLKKQLENPYL